MSVRLEKITVLGLGKVGKLAASLLAGAGFTTIGHDNQVPEKRAGYHTHNTNVADRTALMTQLAEVDAVLSCLPYSLNAQVADVAPQLGIHYFDLTEDVPTTRQIRHGRLSILRLMNPVPLPKRINYTDRQHRRSVRVKQNHVPPET